MLKKLWLNYFGGSDIHDPEIASQANEKSHKPMKKQNRSKSEKVIDDTKYHVGNTTKENSFSKVADDQFNALLKADEDDYDGYIEKVVDFSDKEEEEQYRKLKEVHDTRVKINEVNKLKELLQQQEDLINNPSHYHKGGYDVYEILQMKYDDSVYRGFCIGNILKYTLRHEHKGGLEDLKKAQFNMDRLVENHEGIKYVPAHKKEDNND